MDAEFVVTSWNDEAESLLGWRAEDIIGRSAFKMIPGSGDRHARLRALREEEGWQGMCIMSGKRGRRVLVTADIVTIRDRVGAILAYHSTLRPASDERNHAEIAQLTSRQVGPVPGHGTWRDAPMDRESYVVAAIKSIDRKKLVGANIRRARNARGMTQLTLAQAIRVGRPRVADYEAGAHEPGWDRLGEIARITGVPEPGWFYVEHGEVREPEHE